jgi:hydrogenase maturation protein HypF
VAHDLHPDYLSTRYANEREGVDHLAVQHHHAHLAACLAEHRLEGPAIGVIYDGTGYGPDGTVWGGELLIGGLADYRRTGMLFPVRLPGGDAAIREPWRMACAWLAAATGEELPKLPSDLTREVDRSAWEAISQLTATGVGSPLTSSVGRLFDAVAALCGLRARVNYEGQAAAELEGACDPSERATYPLALIEAREEAAAGTLILDPRETVLAIRHDLERGSPLDGIAGRFHATLARATAEACAREAERNGTDLVVLSGGVFQNRVLFEETHRLLAESGLRVLAPAALPPNDGGISYGQVAVAAARLRAGEPYL